MSLLPRRYAMSSRSASSSPDILGPPGDADFLISSPTKPFAGRQSWMSPANFSLLQTPAKGKRVSLSPAKSAHSIRFDDILLPASPTMKLNGRKVQTSSPSRTQLDGNSSPWRIRVTLEATQDENNRTSPSRKRPRPDTTVTKVPLKGDEGLWEQTPKRRRGRPRKSDSNATPNKGGPGSTPGPKSKRGRPRKVIQELPSDENFEETHEIPLAEPEQRYSPVNLAVEGGSDDEFPDALSAADLSAQPEDTTQYDAVNSSPPRSYIQPEGETLNLNSTTQTQPRNYDNYDNTNIHSPPTRISSPTNRNTDFVTENTIHAGHTPPPPRRIYPTPTSSSLMEEEHTGQGRPRHGFSENFRPSAGRNTNDPTDEHREFDSIMESEGFSMVSLDTLPSAKQHGLASDRKLAKPIRKQSTNGQESGILGRARTFASTIHNEDIPITRVPQPNPASLVNNPALRSSSNSPEQSPDRRQTSGAIQTAAENRLSSPFLPPAQAQLPVLPPTPKKYVPSLTRIIRVGMALAGAFRRQGDRPQGLDSLSSLHRPNAADEDFENPRRRLEDIFSDFGSEMKRELHAAMGFGEALAKRKRVAEQEREIEEQSQQAAGAEVGGNTQTPAEEFRRSQMESMTPQQMRLDTTDSQPLDSVMGRREAEWQREREAVSREIQMANSSKVIVIDSDALTAESSQDHSEGEYKQGLEAEPEPEMEPPVKSERHFESENGAVPGAESGEDQVQESSDGEGYEDIWQQEANDMHSSDFTPRVGLRHVSHRRRKPPSTIPSDEVGTMSPAYWVNENYDVPFLGKSEVRRLREQEVDLSVLLGARDTPNRTRHYHGNSTPQSIISSRYSPVRGPSAKSSRGHGDGSPRVEDRPALSPISEDVPRDDAVDLEKNSLPDPDRDDDASISNLREGSRYNSPPTPGPEKVGGPDTQASWFKRITSLTPAWLKAPKDKLHEQLNNGSNEQWPGEEYIEADQPNFESIGDLRRDIDDNTEHPDAQSTKDTYIDIDYQDSGSIGERTPPRHVQGKRPHGNDHYEATVRYPSLEPEIEEKPAESRRHLALSGYFSDDHYATLRRLYVLAKHRPELFPYHAAPGRADIIGDWIWTSDGRHGVPVTELQFAIVDRFVQQLALADLKAGGAGRIGWTDADLHKRLISIIIGEQIRAERKAREGDGGEL